MIRESPPTAIQVLEPIGLDRFKKDNVIELPREVDDKGEFTEVQVLQEFDPDQFLNQLKRQDHTCPRCMVPMKFGSVQTPYGSTWEYYRCPASRFFTKCYVTCGASEVSTCLKRVAEQTHPCYNRIDPARFRCLCNKSLVLATSHSAANPDRLYLKCPKRTCKSFQWINEPPRGVAEAKLINGQNPN